MRNSSQIPSCFILL